MNGIMAGVTDKKRLLVPHTYELCLKIVGYIRLHLSW